MCNESEMMHMNPLKAILVKYSLYDKRKLVW